MEGSGGLWEQSGGSASLACPTTQQGVWRCGGVRAAVWVWLLWDDRGWERFCRGLRTSRTTFRDSGKVWGIWSSKVLQGSGDAGWEGFWTGLGIWGSLRVG